jgi:hypothetical protein
MTDLRRFTDLGEVTELEGTDIFPLTHNVTTTPATVKITWAYLKSILNTYFNSIHTGWLEAAAWTYASASTFTVAGDVTTTYTKGTKLKWTQTTVKYGVVLSSAYSAGTGLTTVTIAVNTDYVVTTPTAISANYYSYEASPVGFPGYFNYTPAWSSQPPTQPVLNNGTLTGKYQILSGGQYIYHINWTSGNTTTYGGTIWRFSLPIAPAVVNTTGTLLLFDANTNTYYPGTSIEDATGKLIMIGTANTYYVGATVPITFANGDGLTMTGTIFY